MQHPKISVITVVFNSKQYIEATIKSIISQDYNNKEYIIIDGKSTDGTLDIINNYRNNIDIIISEPDKGLYDAMNKGLKKASGDFVIFINSGDKLRNNNTLSNIMKDVTDDTDIIYGDTEITDSEGNILHSRRHRPPQNLKANDFLRGMLVCHQSFVARKSITEEYNTNYRYASDFDWCVRCLKKSRKNLNSNQVIALFMEGGQTRKTIVPGLKERYKIMKKHYGFFRATFLNIILGIKFSWWMLWHRWF